MPGECRSLIEVLTEVPEFRSRHGRRPPWVAILAMACAATLCGARTYAPIADWGRNDGADLARALGVTRPKTPCAATLHAVWAGIDREALERALGQGAEAVWTALPPQKSSPEALAIDGKTLRGSLKQGALDVHRLSVLSHRLGLTRSQQAVAEKTNEIGAIETVLAGLVLEGRVVTVDALLCQQKIAQTIVDRGGTT